MTAALNLTGVDALALLLLGLSAVVGLWRGVVFELMALAGWLVAWLAAQVAAPTVAPLLPATLGSTGGRDMAALAAGFVAALALWGVLARLLRMALAATPLLLPDRLLGALFGGLRAVVLAMLAALVVGNTAWHCDARWRQSHSGPWLERLWAWLAPVASTWLPARPSLWPFTLPLTPCAASSASSLSNPSTN